MRIDLETFRCTIDGNYAVRLASDYKTNTRLTAHLDIEQGCGQQRLVYRVEDANSHKDCESLAEASRRYWEKVYSPAPAPQTVQA